MPTPVRKAPGLKQGDGVTFKVENGKATLIPAPSPVDESFQVAPPLNPPRSQGEIDRIVREEIALNAAREGLSR
jgi:bifunctional DNA-binding transcriptional regulator/antitoxin component of YhaV-PrlF toxin-antitoxin module